MDHQVLGTSDLNISRIGFGCMSLKPGQEWNEQVLHRAVEQGINYFDTADLYDKGLNEELVGRALKNHREKVILATKVGNQWRPDGSGWDWNPSRSYILSAAEQSLRRLQTDRIDLYQLHGGTLSDPIDETIEAFETLVRQGKIRHYGISSIRPNVIREWVRRSRLTSVMLQYSLLDRRPEETLLPLLQQHRIGVLARGSVAQGLLVNKPSKPYLAHPLEAVQSAANILRSISGKVRKEAQTALQFVLDHPAITSAVAGIRTLEQLEEAAGTLKATPLSTEERQQLQEAAPALRYEEHR